MRLSHSLRAGALALAGATLAAAPAPAAQQLADATLSATSAKARSCQARQFDGAAGVVQRRATTDLDGLLQVRLRGAQGTDWDLAVFDVRSGDLVAASAHRGSTELAEGFVGAGRQLVLQACRVAGSGGAVSLDAIVVPTGAEKIGRISLVRVNVPTEGAARALDVLGLDETEHARPGFQDVVTYGEKDLLALTRAGLTYSIVTADLVASTRQALNMGPGPDSASMPSGRTAYRRLADYSADMKKLATDNPTLVKGITLPKPSLEGRPIEGIEITKDVDAKDGKPVFLQMGVHHAREWPSAEMSIEFAFDIINKFRAGDARATALLDKARLIVVPVVNPDGFNLSREAPTDYGHSSLPNQGFAYKRKNCRVEDYLIPEPGECGQSANRSLGTDPNRNYGGLWGGGGASTSVSNDTYRGSDPFSEPETQNVQALVSSRQVTALITNHTYSDLVLRPPGIAAQGDTPDEPAYKALGDAMAAENGYTSQKSWQLYDTTGTTEDWSYFATGGFGFTFEIGKAVAQANVIGVNFHPAYPLGVMLEYHGKYATGGGNREAYMKAFEAAANPALHSVLEGSGPAGGSVEVFKTFLTEASAADPASPTGGPIRFRDTLHSAMAIPASGRFEFHVNPSTRPMTVKKGEPAESWKVTCKDASGAVVGTTDVIVGRGARADVSAACAA